MQIARPLISPAEPALGVVSSGSTDQLLLQFSVHAVSYKGFSGHKFDTI
jgi:hypothetical protein